MERIHSVSFFFTLSMFFALLRTLCSHDIVGQSATENPSDFQVFLFSVNENKQNEQKNASGNITNRINETFLLPFFCSPNFRFDAPKHFESVLRLQP